MKTGKKHRLLKIFAVLIVFTVLFSLFACAGDNTQNSGKNNDAKNDNLNAGDSSGETEEITEMQNPIPKDVTFGGEEIRIINSTYYPEELIFVNVEGEIGEIVNDAVYRRNLKVQNDLSVNFKFIDTALLSGGDFQRMVRNSVKSGSDDYDILIGVQYDCVQLATANLYTNLIGAPYIDLDKPWWAAKHIQEEMSIGKDTLYFLAGDISLNFIRNMGCAFFNKYLYSEYFGNPDDMYKLVLDGKWTLDKLDEMCRMMYKDLNGDGKPDNGDQYGSGVITGNLTDHFTYSAGIRATARDDQGVPYFVMNSERTATFTDKLHKLYYGNEGVKVYPSTEESVQATIPSKFMNNELLFDFGFFYISEYLRDMKSDYGLIPFPKYDEGQPSYFSLAHDIIPLYCVPTTCTKMEAVSAVLEAMAFESYKTVVPAYYEIALKLKYTRDTADDAFKIIDMIHDNVTTDFAYVYNYALQNIGLIMRDLMGSKSADFVSKYEKLEPKAQTSLEKLINTYLQNN